MTGLTNSTLATLASEDLHGPGGRRGGRRDRQIVRVEPRQLERTGQVVGDVHARGEPEGAPELPEEPERRRVVAAERVAHDPVRRPPAVDPSEESERRLDLGGLRRWRERIEPHV